MNTKEQNIFTVATDTTPFGVRLLKGTVVVNKENGARFILPVDVNPDQALSVMSEYAHTGLSFWSGTQAEYDAITTKDDNTIYFITA